MGPVPLGNTDGVDIAAGASHNTIGGTTKATADVISGNSLDGVQISDPGTEDNLVEGDFIGTNDSGTSGGGKLANGNGVVIADAATDSTIGGTSSAASDLISGNTNEGVIITDSGTVGNVVAWDDIGTQVGGKYALPNYTGVLITNAASDNTLNNNVIGGNTWDGGNGEYGIILVDGAANNVIASNNVQNNDAGGIATFGTGSGNQYYSNYSANNGGGGNYIWD